MSAPEIVPCRMCKGWEDVIPPAVGGANNALFWAECQTPGCTCEGPTRPSREQAIAAWNELMQPSEKPKPKDGTVRVRIPVHWMAHSQTFLIECQGTSGDLTNFVSAPVDGPIAYITADFPLPTEPPEISNTVEASDE